MKIWICIPVFNRIQFTLDCLESLKKQDFKNATVVVCDHGSTDFTTARINEDYPEVVVINADSNLWWTGAMNCCVRYVLKNGSSEDYLLTLNNDTQLPSDYLSELDSYSKKYPNSVITSVIHDIKSKEIVSIGHRHRWLTARGIPVNFELDHLVDDENVISVTHASGRGTMYPLGAFQNVGLYDEKHLPHYCADYDFSQKVRRAGFPIYVCRSCRVFSYVEATGMAVVRNEFSLNGFVTYITSIKSPANIRARWWYCWNNCPILLIPSHIAFDLLRILISYFKYFVVKRPKKTRV